jgi:hypothetical protein
VRPRAIPLADLAALAHHAARTRRLRAGLIVLLTVLAALALLGALRLRPLQTAFVPQGTNGVVVLDVSASISDDHYARIAATLDRIARSRGRYGLVVFSDVAYQALPPGTRAAEFKPYVRFFDVGGRDRPGELPELPRSPWTDSFSAGTRISTGLELALDVIRFEQLRDPAVLLVSDLDNESGDLERVTNLALAYRRAGIPIHVVGLNPDPEDEAFMRRLVPGDGSFTTTTLPSDGESSSSARVPATLVVFVLLCAFVLGLLLVSTERLRWKSVA